jgi:single-strand DNA-binding protein
MINKAILIGNLGRDPEVRSLPSGQPVANFSIATNRRWTDREGNRQEQTEWHNLVCFGRQAEVAGQYLKRGDRIYAEGRLQTRSWDDRDTGKKVYRTEIIVENFQMLGSRGGPGGAGDQGHQSSDYSDQDTGSGGGSGGGGGGNGGEGGEGGGGYEDDDIPF